MSSCSSRSIVLVLVVVLVLERLSRRQGLFVPTPGGEPLWHVPDDLATFVLALHPTKECRNGRLPRITRRDAFTHGFGLV
jgi:hypothetical protein